MSAKTHVFRNGALCVAVFLACYVAAWPVAQMGFMDDWSYVRVAQVFAATGRVAYNGWPVETLGWMIPWGALFIKMFGFSFMAVKVSTLPVAVGTLLLFHASLRRFEIGAWNAVIGTLTLGLSPLFLPLSASFMTDIPGLFAIVLCLYLCQRAIAAATDKAAIAWLVLAAASNMVTGTARQVAWLGVLVMVPCTGWLLRKRRGVLPAAMVLWAAGGAAVLGCMRWFAMQPYSIPAPIFPGMPRTLTQGALQAMVAADLLIAETLCLLLMVFPLLTPWMRDFGKKADHYILLLCGGFLPLLMLRLELGKYAVIWPQEILYKELSTRDDSGLNAHFLLRHSLAPVAVQMGVSLFLLAGGLGCFFALRSRGWKASLDGGGAGRQMFWLVVPYSVSYGGLLFLLAAHGKIFGGSVGPFDRYVLGLMPCAIAGLLWAYQKIKGPRLPGYSAAFVALYAVIGVAGTHDWFAWQRARLAAIGELRTAGIPRTEIAGGFEYDGWTQLQNGGHINDPRIRVPAGAYRAVTGAGSAGPGCEYWFLSRIPRVQPKYAVGLAPSRCYEASRFAGVPYVAWLPPFQRVVEVQRVPGSGQ